MTDIITWIQANWEHILAAWGALVALATIIVKITPTKKDDQILAKIVAVFDWFSVVNPNGSRVVKDK